MCDTSSSGVNSLSDVAQACLMDGGILLFPTETWYAVGAKMSAAKALAALGWIKERPSTKPFPLAACDQHQVARFCQTEAVDPSLLALWPAPLTVLLPKRDDVSLDPSLVNGRGEVAVRVAAHPMPRLLARVCGELVTVSSANCAGHSPVRFRAELDPVLLARIRACEAKGIPCAVVESPLAPQGIAPSTIVRPTAKGLELVRDGAFSQKELAKAGFSCFVPKG